MSVGANAAPAARATHPYWVVPVLRAIPALGIGLTVTFLLDHSARVGLLAFGVFALVSGVIVAVTSTRTGGDRVTRQVFAAQGALAALFGAAAIALSGAGVAVLLLIVTVFAAMTGFLEIYAGLRSRGTAAARDWVTTGAFTAVTAVVFLLLPPDSVIATGLIGVYAMILGVYLVIAGLSLKWGATGPTKGMPS